MEGSRTLLDTDKALMLEIELLQVALGNRTELSCTPSDEQWEAIYRFANEQAITGVLFGGIERLPKHQLPGIGLLMNWYGQTERIKQQNGLLNKACIEAIEHFGAIACDTIIIKGQSVGMKYPHPEYRTSGDIDIWCVKRGCTLKQSRKILAKLALQKNPSAYVQPHHVDYDMIGGVAVELHFTPSTVFSFKYDKRIQRYFETVLPKCRNHMLPVDADVVFQLMHLRRHLICEGVGMRQVCDLYMTCSQLGNDGAKIEKRLLRHLGLWSFARAMAWVIMTVFENENQGKKIHNMLGEPDALRGRFVLNRILKGGNFGVHDEQTGHVGCSRWQHMWYYTRLALRNARWFPRESLCNPIYRVYVGIWNRQFRKGTE